MLEFFIFLAICCYLGILFKTNKQPKNKKITPHTASKTLKNVYKASNHTLQNKDAKPSPPTLLPSKKKETIQISQPIQPPYNKALKEKITQISQPTPRPYKKKIKRTQASASSSNKNKTALEHNKNNCVKALQEIEITKYNLMICPSCLEKNELLSTTGSDELENIFFPLCPNCLEPLSIENRRLSSQKNDISIHIKERHNVRIKFKLRENILKNDDFPATEENVHYLSTTKIAREHNLESIQDFFSYLLSLGYLTKENKTYNITLKANEIGAKYRKNNKGEQWVVWKEKSLDMIIKTYISTFPIQVKPAKYTTHIPVHSLPKQVKSIQHMTHISNLKNILHLGLLPHNSMHNRIDISNQSVNSRRTKKEPIYNNSVHDYIPFYYNARNAMLYQVQKEFENQIIILEFDRALILENNVLFSEGNAASVSAKFTSSIDDLSKFNWNMILSNNWWDDQRNSTTIKHLMMSECLILDNVSIKKLNKIHCINMTQLIEVKKLINSILDQEIEISMSPQLFFK